MQKTTKALFIAAVATLSSATLASHAFADCNDAQADVAGKAVAAAASAKIAGIVPGQSKQMLSVDDCDASGANVQAEFKYNVIGSDGLYWAQGKAKIVGSAVQELKFTSLSPNLAAASAKSGVKLASN